jgi:acyl-coenzyme A thioesterase 9
LSACRLASSSASGTDPHNRHHHHHVPLGSGAGGGNGGGSGNGGQPDFVGGYTPVTKALWRSRLTWRTDATADGGNAAGDNSAAACRSPPPRSVAVTLPFSRDAALRDTYANPWGFVRLGRLLEDLDSLSGTAAFAHVAAGGVGRGGKGGGDAPTAAAAAAPPPPPLLPQLVTASVDAIELARPLRLDRDLQMSARVVYTGSSSLDVRMEVRQPEEEEEAEATGPNSGGTTTPTPPPTTTTTTTSRPSLVALFSYVALDRATRRPVRVPSFVPATDEERACFEERRLVAEARRRQRQKDAAANAAASSASASAAAAASAAASPPATNPTTTTTTVMRRFAAAATQLADLPALSPPRLLPVSSTRVDNAFVTQPQHRNTAGRVFGGLLLRRAFELSFACCYLFAGSRPAFFRCDDVSFAQPVDVGDLMRFSARVLAAWRPEDGASPLLVAVEAVAERARPDERSVATTNTFRYVFRCDVSLRSPPRVPVPTTAEDAQRVAAMLAELPEEDVRGVSAALEAASRER